MRPHLALTLGDPAGIGPEIVLKALSDPTLTQTCDITVVGSREILQQTYHNLQDKQLDPLTYANPDHLTLLEIPLTEPVTVGQGNAVSGAGSFLYLDTAITHTLKGQFQGIVTGPIAKTHWKAAGHHYPGQTELLAERAGVTTFGMLFVAHSPHSNFVLRTLLATTHIPLSEVPTTLTPALLTEKLDLLITCLQTDFGIKQPQIAIAGLNPHSGENGQLGTEEQDWLIPWLAQQRIRDPEITLIGPVPPDTLWVKPGRAWYNPDHQGYDAYLALYHDQGLIPVKLLAFDLAVNTTIGLPFIRTSPDHGTAFDIAGQGIADATSLVTAIKLAAQIAMIRGVGCRV